MDADECHPRENVAKMSRGEALSDEDRALWLDRIAAALGERAGASAAALGVLAARRGSEKKTRDDGETNAAGTSPRETDPAAHLERIERRVRSVDRQSRPSEETSETERASPAASPARPRRLGP